MKKNLQVKLWRPSFVKGVSDANKDNRKQVCDELLRIFNTIPTLENVMLTDECAIYCSNQSQNICFWRKENPQYYEELEYKTRHVMMWAVL